MPSRTPSLDRVRRRSVGFVEHDGETWSCFLVTCGRPGGRCHGYFSFRPRDGELEEDEIRTADIFLEDSEAEVDRKARGLGRPLLNGLLASALHTARQKQGDPPRLRRWFREMLAENARELLQERGATDPVDDDMQDATTPDAAELARVRSLYESYRMDQVAHFISLIPAEQFRDAVETILDGTPFEFGARDRLQFAMMVVEYIERRLPLPPFEIWAEDYLSRPETYRLYAHTLHREGRLP